MRSSFVLSICAAAGMACAVHAQPANDHCDSAEIISGTGGFGLDSTGADTDGAADTCATGNIYQDVWFQWTALATEVVTFSLCDSTGNDTVIAVYDGAGCPAGGPVACNDDSCEFQSRLSLSVNSGQTYMIRVGSYSEGDTMSATLAISGTLPPPANDHCDSPNVIDGFGTFPVSTDGTDTDGAADTCGAGTIYQDVWFEWTAAASGNVQLELCGSTSNDTTMAVYDGAGCPGGAPVVCNDDSCGLQSKLNFAVSSGSTYMIRVGSYYEGNTMNATLAIQNYVPGVVAGPIVSPVNGNTYYMLEASSWTAGEASAVAMGGHLATVRSEDENNWLFNDLMKFDGYQFRRGWIGINDQEFLNSYVWTSGEPVSYTNWGGGEPNHANGTEFYGQIPWYATGWNDNSDLPGDDPCYPLVEIITVTGCPADFDGDGTVDFFDYDAFVVCFEDPDCTNADFDGDGTVDFFDYDAFVGAFETPCP